MRLTALALMPAAVAIMSAVQCVVSPGGSASVRATTRSATSGPSRIMRDGRVLSRKRPSTPSVAKRSCQRHTQVFDLPGLAHDLDSPDAIGTQQDDLGPPDVLLGRIAIPGQGHQALVIGW
jgi:hypothetical protein